MRLKVEGLEVVVEVVEVVVEVVEGVVADSMEPSVLGELRQSQPHHSKLRDSPDRAQDLTAFYDPELRQPADNQ